MLVYFRAENFRSIQGPVELDLRAAPRLRRLKGHVRTPTDDKSLKLLKAAVLYGANASGKSNILKAMRFAQEMVIGHTIPNTVIASEPFALTPEVNSESSFYFEFVLGPLTYGFGVRFNKERILEESLTMFVDSEEIPIYSREFSTENKYIIGSATKELNAAITDEKIVEFEILLKYTSHNRLFIAECAEKGGFDKLTDIGPLIEVAYSFFEYQLVIIFPETPFEGKLHSTPHKTRGTTPFTQLLKLFDTGIEEFHPVEVDIAIFPTDVLKSALQSMNTDLRNFASFRYQNQEYCVEVGDKGAYSIFKIDTIHQLPSGQTVSLALEHESDGTRRLLDLLPTILQPQFNGTSFTFVIDEFDRSLHPNLAKAFLKLFLNSEHSDNNNQLIVTTHEAELLDNDLLRRDEIWFVQKEWDASSRLYCLNDYSTRFDQDIHKAYLAGKFGAVPIIMDEFKKP